MAPLVLDPSASEAGARARRALRPLRPSRPSRTLRPQGPLGPLQAQPPHERPRTPPTALRRSAFLSWHSGSLIWLLLWAGASEARAQKPATRAAPAAATAAAPEDELLWTVEVRPPPGGKPSAPGAAPWTTQVRVPKDGQARRPTAAQAAASVPPAANGNGQSAVFDTDILSRRGLNPQIADYFRDAPRFSPGRIPVNLYVNDIRRGRVSARFDADGQLCFDQALLDGAGLVVPPTPAATVAASPTAEICNDYAAAFPGTAVLLLPGQEEVRLIVPTAALRLVEVDFSGYSSGGTAMLLNYDALAMRSENNGSSSDFASLNTELGLNLNDWILRSRAFSTQQNGSFQSRHLYAYAQRTWLQQGTTLQAGQINIANSLLGSTPLNGIQIFPDPALQRESPRNAVMVEGIAQSQARIEVRQAGALIFSTVVPPGPFALSDLPLLNSSSDLDVTVIETNGAQRRFTVPAGSLNAGSLGQRPGYSFALGKSRDLSDNSDEPWVVSANGNWVVGRQSHVGAGALVASDYRAISWGADTLLWRKVGLKLQQSLSQASKPVSRNGSQIDLSGFASALPGNFSLSLSSSFRTRGYRTLSDTTLNTASQWQDGSRFRSQYTAALGWTDPLAGGFSLSYSQATQQDRYTTQRLNAAWGRSFDFGTLSLNVQHDLGGDDRPRYGFGSYDQPTTAYYLTLSVPLGRRNVRTFASNSSGFTRAGAAFSDRVSDSLNYSITAEHDGRDREQTFSGQMSALPGYAQVGLGASGLGTNSRSYYGSASGGLVAHGRGLTASPYAVQDTFGILSASGMPGIKIGTPQGPVWTDAWGRAVIPSLAPYGSSRIEVSTRTLPHNVDIRNGFRLVDAGRGSVNHVDFELMRVRNLLLNARDAEGKPLPTGAFVLDDSKQVISIVLDRGQVFLNNGATGTALSVALPENRECVLDFTLPETPDTSTRFETADAVCRTL